MTTDPELLSDMPVSDAAEWVERVLHAVDTLPATHVLRSLGLPDVDEADVRAAVRLMRARDEYREAGQDYYADDVDCDLRDAVRHLLGACDRCRGTGLTAPGAPCPACSGTGRPGREGWLR